MEEVLREAVIKLEKYTIPGYIIYVGDSAYPVGIKTRTVSELVGSLRVIEDCGVKHPNFPEIYRAIEEFKNIRGFLKGKEREMKADEIRSYLSPIIAAAKKLLGEIELTRRINADEAIVFDAIKKLEDLKKCAMDLKANFEQQLQNQKEKYENELKKRADEIESFRKKHESELKEKADEIESLKKQLSGKFEAIPQPEWKLLFRVTELGYLVATDAKVKDVLPKIKMYGEDLRASGDEENYGSDLLRLYRFLDGKGLSPDRGIRDVTGATEDLKRMREELEKLLSAAIEYYKGRVGESL